MTPFISCIRVRTHLFWLIGALALLASATACKTEEDLRFWGDGSGSIELRITIDGGATSSLDEVSREIERRGFAISQQTVDAGRTTLHATRTFATVGELNEASDNFQLEVERGGPLQRTFRFYHASSSVPNQLGFSRVLKVRFPVPVNSSSTGTIAGQGVVWDASSGGSISIEASGFVLPFGRDQTLLFWTALVALLLGTALALKLGAIPLRRCGNCRRQIDLAVRYCSACGSANDVDEEQSSVRSVRRPRAASSLRLLAQAGALAGLGVLLYLAVSALPAELATSSSGALQERLRLPAAAESSATRERTPTTVSPEAFLADGAFDPVTGRAKVWYAREGAGAFALFDGPGFDPASRLRLQPLTPQVLPEAEGWARKEAEKRSAGARVRQREQEHQDEERLVDHYLDRSALGTTPVSRAAVVHVLPNRDLAIDGISGRLRDAVRAGHFETIPLFRDAVSNEGVDRELFAGNSSRTLQLHLSKFCGLLILAQAKQVRPTVRTEHFSLAEVGLELRAIDPKTGRVLRSAETFAKGGGPNEEAARADALRNLGDAAAVAAAKVLQ